MTGKMIITISSWLSVHYSLAIIVLGCSTNSLSLLVFSRRAFEGNTAALYFRFLAIVDIGAVLAGMLRTLLKSSWGYDVTADVLSCRVHCFVRFMFTDCSSWTLVAMSVQRAFSIHWPCHVKRVCTIASSKLVIVAIILTLAGANSSAFFLLDDLQVYDSTRNKTTTRHCLVTYQPVVIISPLFWSFANFLGTFGPSFLLVILNVAIMSGIVQSKQRLHKFNNPHSQESATPPKVSHTAKSQPHHQESATQTRFSHTTKSQPLRQESARTKQISNSKSGKNREISLTLTLVIMNSAFIICKFPACIYTYSDHFWTATGYGDIGEAIRSLLVMLMYTNSSLNFALYCITGSKFRSEFKQTMVCVFSGRCYEILR